MKKYEYTILYFRKSSGKQCGMSNRRYGTMREAKELADMMNSRNGDDIARVARREVKEWEVVK